MLPVKFKNGGLLVAGDCAQKPGSGFTGMIIIAANQNISSGYVRSHRRAVGVP